jgi:hypothetical protein
MANEIQLKRSSVSGKVPGSANVLVGEPVVNLADRVIYTKDGSGNIIVIGANLTLQLANTSNSVSKSIADVRTIQFDEDSGFDLIDRANGIARVQMNSTFKTWNVDGQANLVASGLDVVRFVAGSGISISTNANASPQEIRFDATGVGGTANIAVLDEGSYISNTVSSINFTGSGVSATAINNAVTVNIALAAGAFDYGYIYEPFSSATLDYGDI